MVDVTFVDEINGPGDYVPRRKRSFAAGDDVLLYGEFAGFAEQPLEGDRLLRGFAGELLLLDQHGDEIDRIPFLTEEGGRSVARDPAPSVNFWARYRLPAQLANGRYELQVHGRDVLADRATRAALTVRVLDESAPEDREPPAGDEALPSLSSGAHDENEEATPRPSSLVPSRKRRAVPMRDADNGSLPATE